MSVLNNSNAIPVKGGEYFMTDSIRFRGDANRYLQRSNTASNPNPARYSTLSFWVKKSNNDLNQYLFSYYGSSVSYTQLYFNTSNQLQIYATLGATVRVNGTFPYVFRDPSAWYHIVLRIDTNNATSSERVVIFVNGVKYSCSNQPTQGNVVVTDFWTNPSLNRLGADQNGGTPLRGYIAHFHHIKGQALNATDFGEYNQDTGAWSPKKFTGSYGDHSTFLDMTTSGTTILDQSGNSQNFTAVSMDFTNTTAHTYDKMKDVPTLTDEDTGNFPTLNTVTATSLNNVINAAQTFTWNTASENGCHASMMIPKTGKWYWEVYINNQQDGYVGITQPLSTSDIRIGNKGWFLRRNGWFVVDGSQPSGSGTGWGAGSTVRLLIDSDNNQLQTYVNNTANSVVNYDFTTKDYFAMLWMYNATMSINFGQRPFKYAMPSGYKKLNSFNLPDSAVPNGREYFNQTLYTGNGTSGRSVTTEFKPEFLLVKARSNGGQSWHLNDIVRGAGSDSMKTLYIDNDNVEATSSSSGLNIYGNVSSIDTSGFTLKKGSNNTIFQVNENGWTYSSWYWKLNGTPVSNTNGSITSTVSANTDSGCSVVSYYSGSVGNKTVGHGLGAEPKMIITKSREDSSFTWVVYHKDVCTDVYKYLSISNTDALQGGGTSVWGASLSNMNASTFGIRSGWGVKENDNCIAYVFAEVEGFSKFGSYIANSSSNGPFVYTGFRPAFIFMKNTSRSQEWIMHDSKRKTYNVNDVYLRPDADSAEGSGSNQIDILSNGFKIRTSGDGINYTNGDTFIYMAFAENPFKNALAR